MKKTAMRVGFALACLTTTGSSRLTAQSPAFRPPVPGKEAPPTLEVATEASHTFAGQSRFHGEARGRSGATASELRLAAPIPLGGRWVLMTGLELQDVVLDTVPSSPVPSWIHTLGLQAGLGYRWRDDLMFMAMATPSLHKLEDTGGNDIGLSGMLNATWNLRPDLTFVFGLMVTPESDLKALPVAGLDWRVNDEIELSLLLPRPRMTWHIDERWSFHAGAGISGTTFRTGDSFGTQHGDARLNDALATYRDIHLALGIGYRITRTVRAELEAGYSIHRRIDYTRVDERVRFAPAPFVRLGLGVGF